jgi:hypothetical protein
LDKKYVRYRTQKWGGLKMIALSLIQDETYNPRHSHGEEKVECDTARLGQVARDTVCFWSSTNASWQW